MQCVHKCPAALRDSDVRSSIAHDYSLMLHASCSGTERAGTGSDSCPVRAHGTPGRACKAVLRLKPNRACSG
eukprot:15474768-Alexandrium_andersonii.AAC.1